MRKYSAVVLSILFLSITTLFFSSCKEDEDPVKPKLSFASAEMTVNEADGVFEIEIVLDKPAPEDIEISYELDGSALDEVTAGGGADYAILGDYLEVVIEKGQTTGIIEIELFTDLSVEDDETIEISITEVDSDKIEITRDDEIEITVEQEDGLFIVLEWGIGEGEEYDDVDMDLFFWWENNSGELVQTLLRTNDGSFYTNLNGSFASPEFFFIPAVLDDGSYGASYNYYEGSEEEMNFTVTFIDMVDGTFEPVANRTSFNATYTLENINVWDDEVNGTDPKLAQTFEKSGATFSNFSEITVHDVGSRSGSSLKVPAGLKKSTFNSRQSMDQNVFKNLKKN